MDEAEVRELIESEMKTEPSVPGAAVVVVDESNTQFLEGFGFANLASRKPVTPDTAFSLQSISKTYTATVVMLAVQEGLVELHEPIKKYFPEFRVNTRFDEDPASLITLRHLLSHTAGFTHEAPIGNNYDIGPYVFDEHIQSIFDTWLRYPVGQRYEYSNLGIDLAAYIVERVSKQPFIEYARERLFAPLGLTTTSYDIDAIRTMERAIGYREGQQQQLDIGMVPSGGLYTSARDAGSFIQFHLNDGQLNGRQVLDSVLLDEMYAVPFAQAGQSEGYGLGVFTFHYKERKVRGHNGGGFGFLTAMSWLPDHGIGVAVLTNSTDASVAQPLALKIIDLLVPPAQSDKGTAVKGSDTASGPAPDFDQLLGSYHGRGNKLEFKLKDEIPGFARAEDFLELTFVSNSEAVAVEDGREVTYRFVFEAVGEGPPLFLVRSLDGTTWSYNDGPNDPPGPDKPEWDEHVGKYTILFRGTAIQDLEVQKLSGYLYIDELRLVEHEPGFFFTTTGEALDFRGRVLTLANIPLSRARVTTSTTAEG